MTRVLVTGAAGFVGSNLVRALLERGEHVIGMDNFETGRRTNLTGIRDHDAFEFVEGDLLDQEMVASAMNDVECVYHQGALPSVPRSVNDPRPTTRTNCVGTANVLTAARDAGVDTVVVASSSSVYGSGGELPKEESMPTRPESPYALSKVFTEQLAMQCSDLYGIDTVALRYFNVFGPRQNPQGDYAAVIPKFINRMLRGERPVVYGDGDQSRDFTFIENVVEVNIAAATTPVSGETFNVACGERTTINALVDAINEILGTEIEPGYTDPRPGDVRHSLADISKARRLLSYEPSVGFETGLERTIAFFRDHSDPASGQDK